MRTFAALASDLTGMNVTGIKRVFPAPPESLNTADLPAMWPMLPEGEQAPLTFGASEYGGSRSLELWVAIQPAAQSTMRRTYEAMTTLLDALDGALRALDMTVPYRLTWAIRGSLLTVAGTDYRGAVVTATAEED